MECQDLIRYLSDYIDRDLSDELTEEAQQHLATCHNCHVVLDSTQRTILLYRNRSLKIGLSQHQHETLFRQLTAALVDQDHGDSAGGSQ